LRHFDVVQGIRPIPARPLTYIPFIKSFYRLPSRSDSFEKAIVSLGNYYLLRLLFGVPFHDFQNITFYSTKMIKNISLQGNSSFVNPQCLFKAYREGLRFIEVPIRFIPRKKGVGKGTKVSSILESVGEIFSNWISWGWKIRVDSFKKKPTQIFRAVEPFYLTEEVLQIIVPLLQEYSDSSYTRN
jgi:hypothetical protein